MDTFDLLPSLAAGDLSDTSGPELVSAIFRSRASGTLALEIDGVEIRVFFRAGDMCGCALFSGFRTLAQVLLANDWVGALDIDATRAEAQATSKRHGQVLVERGFLTGEQLKMALGTQHRQNLAALLALEGGRYEWRGWEPPPPWAKEVTVDPVGVIVDGFESDRLIPRRASVLQWLGEHAARLSVEWPELSQRVILAPTDRRATALLALPRALPEFIMQSRLPPAHAEALLVTLLLCGAAEAHPLAGSAPPPEAASAEADAEARRGPSSRPPPSPRLTGSAPSRPPPYPRLDPTSRPVTPSIQPHAAPHAASPARPATTPPTRTPSIPPGRPASIPPSRPATIPPAPQSSPSPRPATIPPTRAPSIPSIPALRPPTIPPARPPSIPPIRPPTIPPIQLQPPEPAPEPAPVRTATDPGLRPRITPSRPAPRYPPPPPPPRSPATPAQQQAAPPAEREVADALDLVAPDTAPVAVSEFDGSPDDPLPGFHAADNRPRESGAATIGPDAPDRDATRRRLMARGLRNLGQGQGAPEPEQPGWHNAQEEQPPEAAGEAIELNDVDQRFVDEVRVRAKLVPMQNAYQCLSVTAVTSSDAIKHAYLDLVKRYHPDRAAAPGLAPIAGELRVIFDAVKGAYQLISTAPLRADYDRQMKGAQSQAARSRTEESQTQVKMGEVLLKKRDFGPALQKMRKAVELDPNGDSMAALAWCLMNDPASSPSAKEEAASLIQKALRAPGLSARTYYVAGVLWRTKDPDSAADAFRKSLELEPNHPDASLELRLLEMRQGKSKSAGGGVLSGLLFGKRKG